MTEAEKLAALDRQYRESPNALSLYLLNSALHALYRANQLVLIGPDAVEDVARAIWEAQCQHWGKYREHVPELCAWEDLSPSKQWELGAEAKAALAALGVK